MESMLYDEFGLLQIPLDSLERGLARGGRGDAEDISGGGGVVSDLRGEVSLPLSCRDTPTNKRILHSHSRLLYYYI